VKPAAPHLQHDHRLIALAQTDQERARNIIRSPEVRDPGTSFAFPSQVHYIARDQGVYAARTQGRLPFPEFAPEYRWGRQNTLDYPPRGSPHASAKQSTEGDASV
jgi:hypothetical protein